MLIRPIADFAASAKEILQRQSGGEKYLAACRRLREQRTLDTAGKEARGDGLAWPDLVSALLAVSAENHFIKYDPWDPGILIKSFHGSLVLYQYNPYRDVKNRHADGQKPADPRGGAQPDFLAWETFPENEHFLIWTAASGKRYGILAQPTPIVPGHLIIASLDPDAQTGRHDEQVMSRNHLADMHELQGFLATQNYALGYNDRRAGASVDHFHVQAVPQAFLPLIPAWEKVVQPSQPIWENPAGVRAYLLGPQAPVAWYQFKSRVVYHDPFNFPVNGILLAGKQAKPLLTTKQTLLALLKERGQVFNSVDWRQGDDFYHAVFPRGKESIMDFGLKAGYVEMSGMLVIPDQSNFSSIESSRLGEKGLESGGLAQDAYQDLVHAFLKPFLSQ